MKRRLVAIISILYIVGIICMGIPANAKETTHGESPTGFTYKVNKPENQRNQEVGYFDLQMTPGQKQTVEIELSNSADKEIEVEVSLNGAKTNGNGVIEYGPVSIDNDKSLKYDFSDIVKGPEKIKIPAKGVVPLKLDIEMPETTFDGVISGGIQLKKIEEKQSEKATGIINEYAFMIGMVLSETDAIIQPELELNKVYVGLSNYRNSIFVNLSNTQAAYLEGLTLEVQVMGKDSDAVLYDTKKTNMRVAPNSMMDFPVSMNGEKMASGDYRAHVLAMADGRKWEWNQEFSITDEEVDKYNKQDVELIKEQGINWFVVGMIVSIGLIIGSVIFVIVHLLNKKKTKKAKKVKRKKKKISNNKK